MGIVIRQSLKATIVSYAGAFIGFIILLFLYPYCLAPEHIGLLRLLMETGLFIAALAQLGISNAAIKFYPFYKSSNQKGFDFFLLIIPFVGFLLFSTLFVIFKDWILIKFAKNSPLFVKYVYWALPLGLFLMYILISETYSSILSRIVVPKIIREILVRILTVIVIVLFYFNVINMSQFVFSIVVVYAIALLVNILYLNKIKKIDLSPNTQFYSKEMKYEIFKYSSIVFLFAIGSNIVTKIDVFMIGSKISLVDTGIFSIAFFLAAFIEMPSRAIMQISTPIVSDAIKRNDWNKVNEMYKKTSLNQLILSGLIFLLLWANVDAIFEIMPKGHIYSKGKYVIFFVGLSRIFDAVTGINATIIAYSKYYYLTLYFIFILVIISVANNFLLIPLYGIIGVAIATAISIFVYNAAWLFFVWHKLRLHPFTKGTVKVTVIFISGAILAFLIPNFVHPILTLLLNSCIILVFYLYCVVKSKVSNDFNTVLKQLLNGAFIKNLIRLK